MGDQGDGHDPAMAGGARHAIVQSLRNFHVSGNFRGDCRSTGSCAGARQYLQDAEAFRGHRRPYRDTAQFSDVLKEPELASSAAARLSPRIEVRDWTEDNQAGVEYSTRKRIEKNH